MKKREKKPKSKVRRILEWTGFGIVAVLFAFVMAAQIDAMVHKDQNWGQQLRFGVGNFVVQTNSMEPEYKVGSAIITYRKSADDIYARYTADPNKPIDLTFTYRNYYSYIPEDHPELTDQTNRPEKNIPRNVYGMAMTHRLREIKVNPEVPLGEGRYWFVVSGINVESVTWASNQYQVFSEEYLLGEVVLNSDALGQVFKFIASPMGLFGLLLIPAFYLIISSTIDIFRAMKEPEEAASGSSGGSGTVDHIDEKDRERLKQEMLMQMLDEKRKAKEAQAEAQKPAEIAQNDAEKEEKPAEPTKKEEKSEALSGYTDEQKQALRQQMLAQIMAERAQGKEADKPEPAKKEKAKREKPAKEEKPAAEDKGALAGYSDEDKARLRQQMLAQIMAEKKAAKAEPKKGDDDHDKA